MNLKSHDWEFTSKACTVINDAMILFIIALDVESHPAGITCLLSNINNGEIYRQRGTIISYRLFQMGKLLSQIAAHIPVGEVGCKESSTPLDKDESISTVSRNAKDKSNGSISIRR